MTVFVNVVEDGSNLLQIQEVHETVMYSFLNSCRRNVY